MPNIDELVSRCVAAEATAVLWEAGIPKLLEKDMRRAITRWRYRLKLKAKQASLQRETAQELRQELLAA